MRPVTWPGGAARPASSSVILGCSGTWICGCTWANCGRSGLGGALVVSILGASGSGSGAAGLAAGAEGMTIGRGFSCGAAGGACGISTRGRSGEERTSNSAVTLLRLGAVWVSSVGGSMSGVKVRSIACRGPSNARQSEQRHHHRHMNRDGGDGRFALTRARARIAPVGQQVQFGVNRLICYGFHPAVRACETTCECSSILSRIASATLNV